MTLAESGENPTMGDEGNPARQSSLTNGERKGIMITPGDVDVSIKRGDNCLVGRYRTKKKYNKEAFKTILSWIWRTVGRVTFSERHYNLWLIEFSDTKDKSRVMEGRPWSFDHQILVLCEHDGKTPPA